MQPEWKPLWEAQTETDFLRRVIIAGYYRENGLQPKVGEAMWGNPDGRHSRWVWADGGDVINPLGFQDFPDFPIAAENSVYVTGKPYA
jgi:hypothetical protein